MKELFRSNVNQFNSDWNTLRETLPLEGRIHILQQILPRVTVHPISKLTIRLVLADIRSEYPITP
jgi:hypothetical protein